MVTNFGAVSLILIKVYSNVSIGIFPDFGSFPFPLTNEYFSTSNTLLIRISPIKSCVLKYYYFLSNRLIDSQIT